MLAPVVEGECVSLHPLRTEDVSQRYVRWLNDPRVVAHTMAGNVEHSAESVRDYVRANLDDPAAYLWRIVRCGEHIGNVRLSNIDISSGRCELALIIGEASDRGRGIGSQAIALATDHALSMLGVRSVWAMISARNEQSIRAFRRVGYEENKRIAGYFNHHGEPVDGIWMVRA